MKKVFKDSLTGKDNKTYDIGRIFYFLASLVYFVLAIISSVNGHPWSPVDFSAGYGTLTVTFGVNLILKKSTEPCSDRDKK